MAPFDGSPNYETETLYQARIAPPPRQAQRYAEYVIMEEIAEVQRRSVAARVQALWQQMFEEQVSGNFNLANEVPKPTSEQRYAQWMRDLAYKRAALTPVSMESAVKMKALADFIEPPEHTVDMRFISPMSGRKPSEVSDPIYAASTHCIAGWCALMNHKALRKSCQEDRCQEDLVFAGNWLGLTYAQQNALFCPNGYNDRRNAGEQKRKALEVLRGERPLTRSWLVDA